MTALNKKQIMQACDLKTEKVHVPEWGGYVIVSQFMGKGRDAWDQYLLSGKNNPRELRNFRAVLVALSLVDEAGNLLFTESEAEELGKKSSHVLERLYNVADKINAISAEYVDDLAKNLYAVPSDITASA